MFDGEKSSLVRLRSPIVAYVGANGSGKSLLAVQDCLQSLDAGRRVLSTARLTLPDEGTCQDDTCTWGSHPDHGAAHPLWMPLRSWQDLLDAEHCDVLLDEVTGVASARDSSSLPGPVADMLVQLRRRNVQLRWTAPAWARADLLLRECTQAVVLCRGLLRRRVGGSQWPTATWVWHRMVDARDLDELTQAQRMGTSHTPVTTLGWGLQRIAATRGRLAYDTLDSVSSLSGLVTRGTCLVCAGRRTQPACSCDQSDAGIGRQPGRGRRAAVGGASLALAVPDS